MSKKAWLIAGSSVVLIGAGVFVWWKFFRTPKDDSTDTGTTDTPSSTGGSYSGTPAPVDRPSDITAFQQYAKSKGADLGKSGPNKDGVDGQWGSKTQAAWDKYKTDYNKQLEGKGAGSTTTGSTTTGAKRKEGKYPLYAKHSNTPIYNNLNDWFPYRLAKYNENVGDVVVNSRGNISLAYSERGNKYIPVVWPNNETKYVPHDSVSWTKLF